MRGYKIASKHCAYILLSASRHASQTYEIQTMNADELSNDMCSYLSINIRWHIRAIIIGFS